MADIIHKNLPDSELHEPKGIASAAADQVYVSDGAGSGTFRPYDQPFTPFEGATAGFVYVSDGANGGTLEAYDKEPKGVDTAASNQVYVSDGAGSGTWQTLSQPITPMFASLVSQNDSTISLSAASDSTLKTNSDYTPLNNTSMWSLETSENMSTSASSGQITVDTAGTYNIHFCATFTLDVKGRVGIILGDGVDFETKRVITSVDTTETTIVLSTVVPSIAAATNYGVYIASEGASIVTIQTATFGMERLV